MKELFCFTPGTDTIIHGNLRPVHAYLEEQECTLRRIPPVQVHGTHVLSLHFGGNLPRVDPCVLPAGTANCQEVAEQAHTLAEPIAVPRLSNPQGKIDKKRQERCCCVLF